MAKQTSSDDIKIALTEMFGGAASDWKRLSKHRNGDGETEREFENAVLDRRITVIEDAEGRVRAVTTAEESRRLLQKALASCAPSEADASTFTLRRDSDFGIIANFRPYDDAEIIGQKNPTADYDECVVGGWTFQKPLDTPAKIAQELTRQGFTWDSARQEEADNRLTAEIAAALKPAKPASSAPKL